MACPIARLPLLRNSSVRHYAAAAVAQNASVLNPEVQAASNKVVAVAVDSNSPVTQVSIIFRAGSRNETYDTQGTAHYLRIAAGLSTCRSTGFAITRNIQQLGGQLTATTDRESIAYTLQVTRNNLGAALKFLEDVATQQVFKPWEVSDQIPRMRYELSTISETSRVIELLHKAAYRSGLGYSLYCPKRNLGKISSEALQHFVNNWFTGSRCAVVGVGVPISEMSALAANLNVGMGDQPNKAAKYYGGEVRKDRNSQTASVAVAVESAGLKNEKDVLAYAILQRTAGTGPRVKWGSNLGPLYRAVAAAAGNDPFALSAFNANYTDSGLFGFILSAPPAVAGCLTLTATKWLRSPSLVEADIARGKNQLKCDILCATDNTTTLLENLGQQAVIKGSVSSPMQIIAEIDKISVSDVKSVASKCSSGKLSVAAIGDLCTVPYIEDLS